ncbi:MAG: YbjQ family protein [Ignavibacteriae bacterium HGW-Ignavibacteriae-2]|jgi:uncharacterized protein YbjQ (UPF0145 family)|nr:MAG: YbjQ family protein [Ignavibacteriae bacterium HGW-Ignavibacteriae-2]
MGLKRITASDGEVYFINDKGERVKTGMEVPKGGERKNIDNNKLKENVLLTTETILYDYNIEKRVDVITAECVFGMNIFKDIFAGLSDAFGGRSQTTQNTLRQARETVLRELRIEALNLGANAVIGVDLDYSEFSGQGKSMLFLVASGTAVIIKKKN